MRRLLVCSFALLVATTAVAKQEKAKGKAKRAPTPLEKLLAETDAIAETVSSLRGLPVKRRIARSVMSRKQVTERLLLRMAEDQSDAELAAEEAVYKRLGLLPVELGYKQLVVELLTEQIAGFYDPAVKELYLADWIDVEGQRVVMAHEIDHALQDQAFDLDAFMKPAKGPDGDNSDAQLARQALVEGDGMALMLEFATREEMGEGYDVSKLWDSSALADMMAAAASGASAGDAFDKAPLVLREALLFPYAAGLRFVAAARKGQPWSAVDAMFAAPPASSEQVMHPEKYAAGEAPVAVPLPALASSLPGHARTYSNVVGELMWSVILRQRGIADDVARAAAAGWGGDRLVAFAPDGAALEDVVVVDLSVWDSEADARELFAAVASALGAKASGKTYAEAKDGGGDVSFVERKGARVALVVGAPARRAARVRAELWKGWKTR